MTERAGSAGAAPTPDVEVSVIVPVSERYDDVAEVYHAYRAGIEAAGRPYEIVYVLDGHFPTVLDALEGLRAAGEPITVVRLARQFGESTALTAGFRRARGSIIVTLPAYQQVQADELPKLIAALAGHDMVLARRWPRLDSPLNRLQSLAFNSMLRWVSDLQVRDAGCGVRVFTRRILDEIHLYGDLHRFLPFMAHRQGFRVTEVDARQARKDRTQRIYAPGVYFRRLLDVATIFFLLRFTKRPLRFFGVPGVLVTTAGAAATAWVVAERIFLGKGLATRPALLLGSLLVVLGIQLIAIGLIGEIIIFTHARDLREYAVDEVIE